MQFQETKVAVAQTKPIPGDVAKNVIQHQRWIDLAASNGADVLIFPELSITGYEPTLANDLAMELDDPRLDVFQKLSDDRNITIVIGAPTKQKDGTCISLIIFQPKKVRQLYSKMHLHPDEEPYFVSGPDSTGFIDAHSEIALAICYEISIPEHATNAMENGAKVYAASVAKSVSGIDKALLRLSEIAKEHSMTVLMANSIGTCDGWECAGRSSVWNNRGELLSQLDEENEGILVLDLKNQEVVKLVN